ncbi:MAG: type II toxin-antitoxin system YafQ family toxin [Bacteroidales bacterium]|nr:type II toxin-antitoxin system YafQ family toxin [Bacteroidales bacterium]
MTVRGFFDTIADYSDAIFQILATNEFKKQLSLSYKRNLDLRLLERVIHTIAKGARLDSKYVPHQLHGYGAETWECHVKPDWLLVWQVNNEELTLILFQLGTHSDLFKK